MVRRVIIIRSFEHTNIHSMACMYTFEHLTVLQAYYISIGHEKKENRSAYHRYYESVQESTLEESRLKAVSTGCAGSAGVLDK